MILGLSSPLHHSSSEEWAKKHESLGTRALVFPLSCRDDSEIIEDYRKAAEKHGLFIAEVGIWNNVLSKNAEERKNALDYAVNQLKLADKLGARCCVNVAGTAYNNRWDGPAKENFSTAAFSDTVKSIQYIIDTAKPKNTSFCIECMPWMIPTGPDEYIKLISAVDRKAFGVHIDIVNMINSAERYFFRDEFMKECFLKLHGQIKSCHLKNIKLLDEYTFELRESPLEDGDLNIPLYADLATQEDKNMPMIIEHLKDDEAYLKSLSFIKGMLKI